MFRRHTFVGWSFAIGLCGLLAACSGASSLTSPSAVVPTDAAATASNSGSGSSATGASTSGSSSSGPSGSEVSSGSQLIRVRCEVRSRNARSKISVDGDNLAAGTYSARVWSGSNSAIAAPRPSVGDEVGFDFDSARNDIAAGATAIAANFIQGGSVTGEILSAAGAVVASETVACRVR